MSKQPDEQEVYGDIPADCPPLSQEYRDAVLPEHVKAKLAERRAAKTVARAGLEADAEGQ